MQLIDKTLRLGTIRHNAEKKKRLGREAGETVNERMFKRRELSVITAIFNPTDDESLGIYTPKQKRKKR